MLLAVGGSGLAQAPEFPTKPVRWIAPFAPGGFSDTLSRYLGVRLSEEWKQSVIIENRPGAGGTVGSEYMLRAPADGYTLLTGTISSHAINVALMELRYHPLKDYAAVTMLSKQPALMVAHPSLPARDFKQIVALARRYPGKLSYGTPGIGTSMHMSAELVKQLSGVDLTHVPYKGSAPVMVDVLAGHVPIAVVPFAAGATHVRVGKLRGIGVTSANRSPVLPDVPTLAEQGFKDLEVTSWLGLFVKAGTPVPIVEQLNRSVARLLDRPENRRHFEQEGAELVSSTPRALAAHVEAELARWTKVVRAAGIKPN
ncbi:MAG: tripartite tricarboxylate transporter substrate binding protein [Betaproteobacteria bacterium]|nr:tripartite tricarboxylate transporter substrate binding protein [Betaproteobacteria bacterium]